MKKLFTLLCSVALVASARADIGFSGVTIGGTGGSGAGAATNYSSIVGAPPIVTLTNDDGSITITNLSVTVSGNTTNVVVSIRAVSIPNISQATVSANLIGITDIPTVNKLVAMQNTFNQYGGDSNVVDVLNLQTNFNPLAGLTYRGRQMYISGAGSNVTWVDKFGASFTNGGYVQVAGLPDMRTGSVVVVYCRPAVYIASGNNNYSAWGFYNTNTLSAQWISHSAAVHYLCSRSGTNIVVTGSGSPSTTNFIFHEKPPLSGTPAYDFDPSLGAINGYLKQIDTFSWYGSNAVAFHRGNQGKLNNNSQQFVLTNYIYNTDPLTTFRAGADVITNNPSNCGLWSGIIQTVFILNCPATSNLVKMCNIAALNLAPETVENYYFGDSRSDLFPLFNVGTHSVTNSWSWYIQQKAQQPEYSYQMSINSGASFWNVWIGNAALYNYFFNYQYPPNVKRNFYWEFGINDFYTDGVTASQTMAALLDFKNACHTNAATIQPLETWNVSTNQTVFTYTQAKSTQVTNFCSLLESNAYQFDGIYVPFRVLTQSVMNTNNGLSHDGVHLGSTNAYQACQAIANSGPIYSSWTVFYDWFGNISPR